MASNIDATMPVHGVPTTQSVRDNFAVAKAEIEALQGLTTGGPFLPLETGGDVTGKITAPIFETFPHHVQTGPPFNTPLGIYGDLSGAKTDGNGAFAIIKLFNDTLSAGGGLTTFLVEQNSGGTGTEGNRVAQYINFNFTGGTTNKSKGFGDQYAGLFDYCTASGNVGGTSGAGNAWGTLWGGVISATLASGSTFWNGVCGLELNFGVSAGASASYVQGLKIAVAHHDQTPQTTDYFIGLAKHSLSDVGLYNGIVFGSVDGYWPLGGNATLIGAQASILPTPPAMVAAYGVDFSNVAFSLYAFRSPGFSVAGTGHIDTADGLDLGNQLAATAADLTKGINFYGGLYGMNVFNGAVQSVLPTGGAHVFVVNGVQVAAIGNGIMSGPAGSPTWTTGSAAPAATAPVGSIYSRVGGVVGATLYVSRGGGTWTAVAGV